MEYLIDIHGAEHLFLGGRPERMDECLSKFNLSMSGIEPTKKGPSAIYQRRNIDRPLLSPSPC